MPGFVETLPATSQKQENCVVTLFDGRAYLACKKQATPARWAEAHPTPDKRYKHWLLVLETLQATSLCFSFSSRHHRAEKSRQAAVLLVFCSPLRPSATSPRKRGGGIFLCQAASMLGGYGKKRGGLPPPRSCITAVLPPAVPTSARYHPAAWCAAGRRSIVPPASGG